MLERVRHSLHGRYRASLWANPLARRELRAERRGGYPLARDPAEHLVAAIDWLVRAQDATPDGGISRGYCLAWTPYWQRRGWQPSYPETTGYILSTFFDAASRLGRPELRERARRMADWEIDVQLPSGAVQGGVIGERAEPTPAVFNTGQVILGWIRAHRELGSEAYLEAARRAADWLLSVQDADGGFAKGRSEFSRSDCTSYYTRVAWPLCALGEYLSEERYVEAGLRGLEHCLARQQANGWFAENCLSDPERPLLHTIAYAMRGALEVGLLLGRQDYVERAARTARALAERQRPGGGLAGRFARDWSEAASWECLTGDVQTAIVWWKLGRALGEPELCERARAATRFVMRSQNRAAPEPGVAGGIRGSFPCDGDYGRYEVLNWATKFFADALMLTLDSPTPMRIDA
jgi:hypothetical protein